MTKQRSRQKPFKWLNKGTARDDGRRNVGPVIAVIRKLRGWRQADLARYIGVTPNHLAQVEKSRTRLSDARLEMACEALEVSDNIVTALGCVAVMRRQFTRNEITAIGEMFVSLFEDANEDGHDDDPD